METDDGRAKKLDNKKWLKGIHCAAFDIFFWQWKSMSPSLDARSNSDDGRVLKTLIFLEEFRLHWHLQFIGLSHPNRQTKEESQERSSKKREQREDRKKESERESERHWFSLPKENNKSYVMNSLFQPLFLSNFFALPSSVSICDCLFFLFIYLCMHWLFVWSSYNHWPVLIAPSDVGTGCRGVFHLSACVCVCVCVCLCVWLFPDSSLSHSVYACVRVTLCSLHTTWQAKLWVNELYYTLIKHVLSVCVSWLRLKSLHWVGIILGGLKKK